jgi:hypothetical protein
MDDTKLAELRNLVGQHDKLIYEAVKAGMVDELSPENQFVARAIQEHMHLKHVHHALEFADLREGESYEITVNGNPVSPMAHVTSHAAVKGQIAEDPLVRAAFEKMVATGASAHHAEHVLAALFMELMWEYGRAAEAGGDTEKARSTYYRKIKKLTQDSAFRRKLTRKFTDDHSVFE